MRTELGEVKYRSCIDNIPLFDVLQIRHILLLLMHHVLLLYSGCNSSRKCERTFIK